MQKVSNKRGNNNEVVFTWSKLNKESMKAWM